MWSNILDKILFMNFVACWLILAVIFVRLVLVKETPKYIRCILWAIVAIRLVCPFSIESAFSLLPAISVTDTQEQEDNNISQPSYEHEEQTDDETNVVPDDNFQTDEVYEPEVDVDDQTPVIVDDAESLNIDAKSIFSIIWILGIVVILVHSIISYIRLKKRVSTATNFSENIWVSDDVETPFILGMIKPRIFLPSEMDAEIKKYVLAHEYAHISRKDHIWKPLGFIITCVHWFNPLVWVAYVLFSRDVEMACDEKVIKNLDVEERKAYSKALLACSTSDKPETDCPVAFSEVAVKSRVKSVLNYKKPAFWVLLVAVILCVVLAIGFFTEPKDEIKPEEIYAIGTDGIVTIEEYNDAYVKYIAEGYTKEESAEKAKSQCLEYEATYQEALRQGFKATRKEIRQYIAEMKEASKTASNGPEMLAEKIKEYGSEEAYFDFLAKAAVRGLTVDKYLKDLKDKWRNDPENDFDTFDEYKNVVVFTLVVNEEFKFPDGSPVYYGIPILVSPTEEAVVDFEEENKDKYAAKNKQGIAIGLDGDFETIVTLCKDAMNTYIDSVKYDQYFGFNSYIENDMLSAWLEKRTKDDLTSYALDKEHSIFEEEIELLDNYAIYTVNVGNANYREGLTYFIVQNIDGNLRITDWYFDSKDSLDNIYRGEFKYSFNPTFWENVEATKSEISTGIRFKLSNRALGISQEMVLSDECLIYIMFQNGWSEGIATSDDTCVYELEVFGNKMQYNHQEGVFVDVENNRSLRLTDSQRTGFNQLLEGYCLYSDDNNAVDAGVTMTVTNVTPTEANYILTRDFSFTEAEVIYGSEYWLEKYVGDDWIRLEYIESENYRSWTAIAYHLDCGNSRDGSPNWERLYGVLDSGKYRICKDYRIRTDKASVERIVYGEFEIY